MMMCEPSFAPNFALIALNAQDSRYLTVIKRISLRCVAAATVLEAYLNQNFTGGIDALCLSKSELSENPHIPLYQKTLLESIIGHGDDMTASLGQWLQKAAHSSGGRLKKLEKSLTDSLRGNDLIDEVPNLLGCDVMYVTACNTMREYRSNIDAYTRITESVRAEILEASGNISDETIAILWLLRESSCLPELFSSNELQIVGAHIFTLCQSSPFAKLLFSLDIHNSIEAFAKGLLKTKKLAVSTPTMTGINFIFPVLERSQSIFIETEAWFENSIKRLDDILKRLDDEGHHYTVLRGGVAPLIKIDNIVYEAIPTAIGGRVPIQGMRLRRYPD